MSKVLIGLLVVIAIVFGWSQLPVSTTPLPEGHAAGESQEIIMYATSWCGYCARARKYFNDNDIAFIEYDVEKSREARRQFDQLNGKGVPLLVVNGEVLRGFSPAAVQKAMKAGE